MPARPSRDDPDDDPRPRRRRAEVEPDDEDDEDDRPRPRRRAKPAGGSRRPLWLALAGAGVAALVGVGVAVVLLVGRSGGKVSTDVGAGVPLGVPIRDVERYMGRPGVPVPEAEWAATEPITKPTRLLPLRTLAAYGAQAFDGRMVSKWYRWGPVGDRLYVGTVTGADGSEVAVVKAGEGRSGNTVGHYMEQKTSYRFTKGP